MWRTLHDVWQRQATATHPRSPSDALFAGLCQGVSAYYGAAVRVRNLAYDRRWCRPAHLACPVISVGNLEVGGTGKTACVELIAAHLQRDGLRVAILSRGYGGRRRRPYCVEARDGSVWVDGQAAEASDGLADEPQVLARHVPGVPVLVDPRRARTGRQACEQFGAQVIVLDDGFQHRQLHRDCDIVLIPARMPLGGWPLLPRGPMREPLSSLVRADMIVITKVDESLALSAALQERLRAINSTAHLATAVHAPVGVWDASEDQFIGVDRLERRRVWLLSSIGDPTGFEQTMTRGGATILGHSTFPDHYAYTAPDWQQASRAAASHHAETIVTTEKDWARLSSLIEPRAASPVPLWVLRIQMRLLSGEEGFYARLAAVCRR